MIEPVRLITAFRTQGIGPPLKLSPNSQPTAGTALHALDRREVSPVSYADNWMRMDLPEDPREIVPYGSGYGLENLLAQEALKTGAIVRLDHAMLALAELHATSQLREVFSEHVRTAEDRAYLLRCAEADSEQEWAVGDLPSIYEPRYKTYDFLKNWVVTLTMVGWKLAQPEPRPPTNTAEEFGLHVTIQEALSGVELSEASVADQQAASEALNDLYEAAFEDNDFLELYHLEDSDEIVDLDPAGTLGMTDLRFKNWFKPYGSGVDRGVPHPFVVDT